MLDFQKADLTSLLSHHSVQQLLDIVDQHPEWSMEEMVQHCGLSYTEVRIILGRLHLSTATLRKIRQVKTREWESTNKQYRQKLISQTIPDFFSYITHRKQYQQQQWNAESPVLPQLPLEIEQKYKTYDKFVSLSKLFAVTFILALATLLLGSLVFDTLFHAIGVFAKIGMFFAFSALFFGFFFFLYSLKYYFTVALVLSYSRSSDDDAKQRRGWAAFFQKIFGVSVEIAAENEPAKVKEYKPSLSYNLEHVQLERQPFVSIQVGTYNEKRVIDRFLLAATSMEYENYEIIVADDSTDETVQLLDKWKNHPRVKVSHRATRQGYKGAALKEALKKVDPRTEFILIFDADFIPYPDVITQFLKYFQVCAGTLDFGSSPFRVHRSETGNDNLTMNSEPRTNNQIAAVQGYQWHVLNKSENWITRGVRTEYSGSYIIERSGSEIYQGLKQIAGSVYMIRADVLRHVGWGTSITEDFELTLRLYEQGFKVVYSPYVQAPAEAVSTVKRLIRQRMRWAEGHSFNVKKMFKRLLISPHLTFTEKFEFVYLAPYYLQAFFFIVGTLCWFTSEIIFQTRLPFWTELWGWSLVFTNLLSIPLMNMVGLFMEESEEHDYLGLFSFVVLSYVVAPFQAFAAVKGFLEKEEGPWFRTPKTGRITDSFVPGRFYRFVRGILGRPTFATMAQSVAPVSLLTKPITTLTQAKKGIRWTGKSILAVFLSLAILLNYFTFLAPRAFASGNITVQNGSTTIVNGSTTGTATLGTPVDSAKSFLTFSVSADSTTWTPACGQLIGDFTSYGTTQTGLTFTRQGTACTNSINIQYSVTTMASGVTVQRGIATTTGATSSNVALSPSVDVTISFPLISNLTDGAAYDGNDWVIPSFTSLTGNNASQLNLKSFATSGTLRQVAWQVVTYTNASVQSNSTTIAAASTSQNVTITSVNQAKSWLIYYSNFNATGSFNANNEATEGKFTSNTQINFSKGNSTTAVPIQWFVVTFTDNTSVQSGNISLSTAATSGTGTISAVDTTTSIVTAGGLYNRGGQSGNGANSDVYNAQGTLVLSNSTTVTFTRGITESATASLTYFVVQFNGNPSIEQQINILDGAATNSSGSQLGMALIDTAKYSGTVSYVFVVDALVTSGTGTVTLTYNAGSGATPSGGSTVVVSGITATTYTRYQSSAFTPTGAQNIYISAESGTGLSIQGARMIITQTNSNSITDTVTQIEIGGTRTNATTTSTTFTPVQNPKFWKYDGTKYDGVVGVFLESTFSDNTNTNAATVALYPSGTSCGTQVTGSSISTDGTTTTQRVRSSNISANLTNGTTYMICYHGQSGTDTATVANAKLVIVQSASSGLTKMEMQQTFVSGVATSTSSSYTQLRYMQGYVPSNFQGGTFTYFYESTFNTSSGGTSFTDLYNSSDANSISSSEVNTTSTNDALIRSGSVTMPSDSKELDSEIRNSGSGGGTVTVDATSSDVVTTATNSFNWNHTVTNSQSNLLLMVSVITANITNTVTGLTYNGTALTQLTAQNCPVNCRDEVWYLKNPSTGTHAIAVTTSATQAVTATAISFYNVDQTTPLGTAATTNGSGTASSLSVASNTNQLVADFYGNQATPTFTPTPGGSQTQQVNVGNSTAQEGAISTQPGVASSTSMTWTWNNTNNYADIGVGINPSGTPATVTVEGSWLIIDVSSLSTPEHVWFLFPLIIFLPTMVGYIKKRTNG